ncbi:MAG TPA: hypothetical protein VE818_13045 [Nitrososphaeraceae archaeon]|nr:hypothetical protein [Nitrososphaeraceae archaeon]
MKRLGKVSRPKKVSFIGLGILALGIVVFTIGLKDHLRSGQHSNVDMILV